MNSPPRPWWKLCFIVSYCRALTLNSPPRPWWTLCFTHNFECVTVVTVKAAEGLRHQSNVFGCDSYCEIRCERNKIRTPVVHDSVDPTWDRSFVFYRKYSSEPLTARVLRHRTLLPNVLIGQALLPAPVNHQPSLVRAELQLPGFEDGSSQGVLVLEVTTEDDLSAI
ncbi:hypothetical protein B566_EDAN014572 [Ephemera danica]|nr:hypothetical protein B566_EDAN014572 [Ephemera danica]